MPSRSSASGAKLEVKNSTAAAICRLNLNGDISYPLVVVVTYRYTDLILHLNDVDEVQENESPKRNSRTRALRCLEMLCFAEIFYSAGRGVLK